MSRDVERYLKRATRGLWGHKYKEVREELSAHIEARVTAHRIAGLSEAGAIRRSLDELGNPKEVNTGMVKLHTLPAAFGLGTLAAAVCTAAVLFVSGSVAQTLKTTQIFPSPACLTNPESAAAPWDCRNVGVWTSVEALKEVLEPQGVEITERGNTLGFKFDNGRFATTVLNNYIWADEQGNDLAEEYRPLPGYVTFWEVLEGMVSGSTLPLSIEGWDNPTVSFGNTSFKLGDAMTPVNGRDFYFNYLASLAFNPNELLARASLKDTAVYFDDENSETPTHLTLSGLAPEGIYGVAVVKTLETNADESQDATAVTIGFALDVAQASVDGTVNFELPSLEAEQAITFTEEFTGEPQPGTAALLRLTGEAREGRSGFGYEVVSPERIGLE